MKNLVKIIAVLSLVSSLNLIGMNVASTATTGIRSVGAGVGAHARELQRSHKEYNELYRNRSRTAAQQARFEQLDSERAAHRTSIRQGGIRNINRAL